MKSPLCHLLQVGNTIGKRNRFLFLAFLVIEDIAMASGAVIAIHRLHQTHKGPEWSNAEGVPWILAFIIGDVFMMLGVSALMVTQVSCQHMLVPLGIQVYR